MDRALVLFIFFLSGAAGLLYEVVWTRELTLLLGVTAPAVSTVLATFMGGLGIGGALAGRMLQNRAPLRFYAFCEIGVAAFGAATPILLKSAEPFYVILKQTTGGGAIFIMARAAIAALVLLPPAILMGATLPALAKWSAARGWGARTLGFLYAINTLGAVAGTLGAAFFCIEWFGLRGTIYFAAAINIFVAIAAFIVSRKAAGAADGAIHNITINDRPFSTRPAFAVAALSGCAALACEGLWTRYLVYAVGDNSAYAFAQMLAMFLLGLSAGGFLAAPFLNKLKNPYFALAVTQGLLASACLLSTAVLDPKGRYAGFGDPYAGDITTPWSEFILYGLLTTGKVVLPPTILFGAALPIVLKIVSFGAPSPERAVGRALAWNTAGAIAGAVASGFVLLPILGFTRGMVAVGILQMIACATALAAAGGGMLKKGIVIFIVAAAFVAAVFIAFGTREASVRALIHDAERDKMIFYEDGAVSSVAVVEDSVTKYRTLYVGGDAQASTDPGGMLHLRLLGHLPALLHSGPKSGLVICCGAGVSLGSLASHPLESLEVCDLSPTILDINKKGMFASGNNGVFNDRRLQITVDDGRNHLLTTRKTYDVITTDPIDPDDAGVTSIYSKEFYELVRDRLNPGGVACQWLTIQYSLDVYKSLISAFQSVFPECYLFDADYTTVIVGRKPGSGAAPFSRLERAFDDDTIRISLAEVGIDDPYDLLSLQLAGPRALAKFCKNALPNSDEHPVAETVAPRTVFGNERGSFTKKMAAILAMRDADPDGFVSDWSPAHDFKFRNRFLGMQRAMDARLLRADTPAERQLAVEGIVRSLVSTAPRAAELMALFDRCEFSPEEDVGEYLVNIDFGIEALCPSNKSETYNSTDGAKAAKFYFTEALTIRPDSLRARIGLSAACARLNEHQRALDMIYQFMARARYSNIYLKGYIDDLAERGARR